MDFSLGWFAQPVFHGDAGSCGTLQCHKTGSKNRFISSLHEDYPECMKETCGDRQDTQEVA